MLRESFNPCNCKHGLAIEGEILNLVLSFGGQPGEEQPGYLLYGNGVHHGMGGRVCSVRCCLKSRPGSSRTLVKDHPESFAGSFWEGSLKLGHSLPHIKVVAAKEGLVVGHPQL